LPESQQYPHAPGDKIEGIAVHRPFEPDEIETGAIITTYFEAAQRHNPVYAMRQLARRVLQAEHERDELLKRIDAQAETIKTYQQLTDPKRADEAAKRP
jgi:hypothetical protein